MPITQSTSLIFQGISGAEASAGAIVTASPWLPLNLYAVPFNVSFGVIVHSSGQTTFRVQHTFDDVFDPDVSVRAFTHADVTAATANIDGNYAYPVRAVRIQSVSASGGSNLEFIVIQSGE